MRRFARYLFGVGFSRLASNRRIDHESEWQMSLRSEAIVDPRRVAICHCADCQALTGTAYRVSVPAGSDSFSLRTGSPTIYVKTAESGARRAQPSCAKMS